MFKAELDRELVAEIRQAANTGLALGNDRFKTQVERLTGQRQHHCKRSPKPISDPHPNKKPLLWRNIVFLIIDICDYLYIMRNTMPAKNPKVTAKTAQRLRALGGRIRAQRKNLKINATVAAEAAGMSRITWYRIEKGEPAVTMGAWINAMTVVGLTLDIQDVDSKVPDRHGWIPARIRLADYPELKKLAWHVRDAEFLSAREALEIYQRNQRHLDPDAMTPEETQLLDALRMAFGHAPGAS